MNAVDLKLLIHLIDESLAEFGTSGLVDGRKVRDNLLDIRSLVTSLGTKKARPVEDAASL